MNLHYYIIGALSIFVVFREWWNGRKTHQLTQAVLEKSRQVTDYKIREITESSKSKKEQYEKDKSDYPPKS
jgi:hypothetical protein